MLDITYIKAEKLEYGLILTLINLDGADGCGVRAMQETSEYYPDDGSDGGTDTFGTDDVMYEFFEGFIANTEYEWIGAEEIGALTDAPILGIKDEDGNILEAYGFMDYAVRSLMEDLRDGKVILRKG